MSERENKILQKLQKQYHHNSAIAEKIQAVMKKKGCHLIIGVSSEGLRFMPRDKKTVIELSKIISNYDVKVIK